ncbi:MAG TPA: methyltransferase domain-containing protein [Kofleriaceae bacterium]
MFAKADAYERFMGRWSRQLAEPFLAAAQIGDGPVLDVGTGTGALSLTVRDHKPDARIVGVDLSPEFIAFAQKHVKQRIELAVGDAQHLEFADRTFASTLSLLVLNFVPDPSQAAREMKRVTQPGGVVAAAVWDYEEMLMLSTFWAEAVALDPAAASHDESHMPLSHANELEELWKTAGLENVSEQKIGITLHFASFDDYWEPFLLGQGPAGAYVAKLAPAQRAALKQRVHDRLLQGAAEHPIDLTANAWVVRGNAPKSAL